MDNEFEKMLMHMHHNNVVDDEELFLQNGNDPRRNLHMGLPYTMYDQFDLEGIADNECLVELF